MHFTDPKELTGLQVIGYGDAVLGTVEDVYADMRSGHPQWAAIRTGMFGTDVSLIPLARAEHAELRLRVPYGTREIGDAPHRAPGVMMSHKEEANLFRYYGLTHDPARPSSHQHGAAGQSRIAPGHTRGTGRTMLHKCVMPSSTRP